MPFVSYNDYHNAALTWRKLERLITDNYGARMVEHYSLFKRYLGYPDAQVSHLYSEDSNGWDLSQAAADKINALNSPHAYALWKRRKINGAQS